MKKQNVPVNEPLLDGNEEKYLVECIRTGWISSEGPFVALFEEKMAAFVNRKYGVAVSSGSAALDVAVAALGITAGDEVIMPSHTIISCAAAVVNAGAVPVVVDCDPKTYNLDPELIEEKITEKTKAIMLVHIFGLPVDVDPVLRIAKKYNLLIIEDAAEAHGLTYNGQQCGSFGDVSVFSFYPNKHITTGEGGMVLTDDPEIESRCRYYMNLCFDNSKRFQHEDLGWNYRMTNLQAAIGVAQLERIDDFVKIKRANGRYYYEQLRAIPDIQLPVMKTEYAENIFWVFPLLCNRKATDATSIRSKLGEMGVGTRPFFWPINKQNVFLRLGMFKDVICPNAENIGKNGFYIPSGMALTQQQMDYVVSQLKTILV